MANLNDLLIEMALLSIAESRSPNTNASFDLSDEGEMEGDARWTFDDADVQSFRIGPPVL